MPVVQSSYAKKHSEGYEGQVATTATCDVSTFVADGTAGIGFGLAVKRGTNAGDCALGAVAAAATPFHATDFLGVSVRDRTRDPVDADKYKDNAHVDVLYRGDVYVKVESAVALGDDVTVDTSTGKFSSAAAAADQAVIPNARWMTAAGAGALAILRLGGAPQV